MTLEKYLPLIESPLCGSNCEAVFSLAWPVYAVSIQISPFYRGGESGLEALCNSLKLAHLVS